MGGVPVELPQLIVGYELGWMVGWLGGWLGGWIGLY